MTTKELFERLEKITSMEELSEFILNNKPRDPRSPRPKEVKRRIGASLGRKVYCFETDTIYDSVGHAADELGIKYHQNVSTAAAKGGTTHGYHFKYMV